MIQDNAVRTWLIEKVFIPAKEILENLVMVKRRPTEPSQDWIDRVEGVGYWIN